MAQHIAGFRGGARRQGRRESLHEATSGSLQYHEKTTSSVRDDEIELQDVLLFSKDNFASYKYEKNEWGCRHR